MLNRARDADGDVQIGRDDLARLSHLRDGAGLAHLTRRPRVALRAGARANLVVVGHEAGVDRGAARADRSAQLIRELWVDTARERRADVSRGRGVPGEGNAERERVCALLFL